MSSHPRRAPCRAGAICLDSAIIFFFFVFVFGPGCDSGRRRSEARAIVAVGAVRVVLARGALLLLLPVLAIVASSSSSSSSEQPPHVACAAVAAAAAARLDRERRLEEAFRLGRVVDAAQVDADLRKDLGREAMDLRAAQQRALCCRVRQTTRRSVKSGFVS